MASVVARRPALAAKDASERETTPALVTSSGRELPPPPTKSAFPLGTRAIAKSTRADGSVTALDHVRVIGS